jgi:hypothetical protein
MFTEGNYLYTISRIVPTEVEREEAEDQVHTRL